MTSVCETSLQPPKNAPFKPDWDAIKALVLGGLVNCTDVAKELGIWNKTLNKHCLKAFNKPFRQWAREIRKQADQVSLFSPDDYKRLLQAYHNGTLAYKDRNDAEYAKLRKIKSPKAPQAGGPSTALPLTERFTHSQIGRVWSALESKQIDIGVQVPATYILAVWLDPSIQADDFISLYTLYSRGYVHEWRPTALGTRSVAAALKLFHQELDKRYLNPPKEK